MKVCYLGYKFVIYCHLQVTEEKGPPHLKNFKVECIVGEYKTDGAGNSKKNAKRKAAESMVKNLRMLPSLPKVERPRPYFQLRKKKSKSLIKVRCCIDCPKVPAICRFGNRKIL